MPSRSRKAVFTLAVGVAVVGLLQSPAWSSDDPKAAGVVNRVKLELQIVGLSAKGCEVEVAPGHPGCRFEKVVKRIGYPAPEKGVGLDIEAQSSNADRDCDFAITIREAGHAPKTFHRGLRLTPQSPNGAMPVQSLTCYLSTPSLAARDEGKRPRR